jgi:SOS response associated peptidase (SRAP)
MCGRARLSSDVSEIKLVFRIPPERPTPNFASSWNVAPTDPLAVVRYDAKDHQRSLDVMCRGLEPFWAKDIKVSVANINAKAEGIEKNPAFPEASRQRRCLVPVDNFYEAALCDRAQGRRADGAGGRVGDLALAGRRMRAQLSNRHHGAERIVRRAAQPHACGARRWPGRSGLARSRPMCRICRRCWPPTRPTAWSAGRLAGASAT